jgi:hypothetical protein
MNKWGYLEQTSVRWCEMGQDLLVLMMEEVIISHVLLQRDTCKRSIAHGEA